MLLIAALCLIVASYGVYLYLTWNTDHWKRLQLPHKEFSFSEMKDALLMRRHMALILNDIYNKCRKYKYCGYFNHRHPEVMLIDPELIKTILIKDFYAFTDNMIPISEGGDPFMAKNPFGLRGEHWKLVRSQLNPAFSSGRMKYNFPRMVAIGPRLVEALATDPGNVRGDGVNVKEFCSRFTVDAVAACVLNLDVCSFTDPHSTFRTMGQKIFATDNIWSSIKLMLIFFVPKVAAILKLGLVSPEVGKYFIDVIHAQIKHRKEHNLVYNDFLDFLCDLRQKCTEYDFDEVHMAAHIITFFTDGFETSSGAMSYVLYELAANPDVQEKLQQEIDNIIGDDGEVTYDKVILEMKYLDYCIMETLRKNPLGAFTSKICTVDSYTLPPPSETTDPSLPALTLHRDDKVILPIYSIQHDPRNFPEPERFQPERFAPENRDKFVKCSYLAFGEGPRQCIGQRFATMQLKVGLVAILRNFHVRVHHKMKVPITISPHAFMLWPEGGIWLSFHKRT